MPENPAQIKPLPAEVAAQIKSSTAIPSLSSVVLGLVANSLDAGARKVDISVDFGRGSCVVEDDANGIPSSEFGENGGLGKPYRKIDIDCGKVGLADLARYLKKEQPSEGSWL